MENPKKEIAEFYKKVFSDPDLKVYLTEKSKQIKNREDLKEFIKTEIFPRAQKLKFNFSEKELLDYEIEGLKRLKKEDLYDISGGSSAKSILISSGIFSALFLSAGLSTGSIADAVLGVEQVRDSSNTMQQAIGNSSRNEVQANIGGANNSSTTVETNNNNNDGNDNNNNRNDDDDDDKNSSDHNNNNNDNTGNNPLPKETVEKSMSDLNRATQQNTVDEEFVINAGNLLIPYIENLSGFVEKLRFENGYIKEIHVGAPGGDGVPTVEYNKQSGEGISNVMTSLYPSSAGTLNINGGYEGNYPFTKSCKPTPELMGKIMTFFHHYRNRPPEEAKQVLEFLSESHMGNLNKEILDKHKKFLGIKRTYYDSSNKKISYSKCANLIGEIDKNLFGNVKKKIASSTGGANKEIKKQQFHWNENSLKKLIDAFDGKYGYSLFEKEINFFEEELNFDVKKHVDEQKIDIYFFSRVMFALLYNGSYAISNQEATGDEDDDIRNEKFLPKYTTEHMIGSYCINLFNEKDDVKTYFETITKLCLTTKKLSSEESKKLQARMENYKKLLEMITVNSDSPYKNPTRENSNAHQIIIDDNGTMSVAKSTFQDCGGIATRHMINLVSYNGKTKLANILGSLTPQEKEKIDSCIKLLVDCIDTGNAFPDELLYLWHNIGKRLKLFYYYQSENKEGADAADIITRTIWEFVISHMDKKVPEGFFIIKYSPGNAVPGNELETGFLNCTKLLYNLAYALRNGVTSQTENLETAKTAILALENSCKNSNTNNEEQNKKILINALTSVFKLFNNNEFEIEVPNSLTYENGDCYSADVIVKKIISEKEKLSFSIFQNTGHAKVCYEPNKFLELKDYDLRDFLLTDPELKLFTYKYWKKLGFRYNRWNDDFKENIPPLHYMFFDYEFAEEKNIWIPDNIKETQFFKNHEALRFIRVMQGEGRNVERIASELSPGCRRSNIKVFYADADIKQPISLSNFIFEHYMVNSNITSVCMFLCDWKNIEKAEELLFEDTTIDLAKKYNMVATDSNDTKYLWTKPSIDSNNDEVLIFPLKKELKQWDVPATVDVNGKTYKVCGTIDGGYINAEEIKLSPEIEKFSLMGRFRSTKSVNWGNAKNIPIGKDAFQFCKKLKEFNIPNGVTTLNIGEYTFYNCENLQEFNIPDSVTTLNIGEYTFFNCKNLQEFNIPDSVTTLNIGAADFYDCDNLLKFNIPDSVTTLNIGKHAFSECKNLQEFKIPDSVTTLNIGKLAFRDCEKLEKFNIPNSVTTLTIDNDSFHNCPKLKKIIGPPDALSKDLLKSWKKSDIKYVTNENINEHPVEATDSSVNGNRIEEDNDV